MAPSSSDPSSSTSQGRSLPAESSPSSSTSTSPSNLVDTSAVVAKVQAPLEEIKKYGDQIFSTKPQSTNSDSGIMASIGDATNSSKQWNTKDLSKRLMGDAVSAAAAGGLVAPLITCIDRGIIENASNQATLKDSLRNSLKSLFFRPHVFLTSKPFLLIFTLYGCTYLSANALDTTTSTIRNRNPSHVTSGTSKFLATSTTNLSLCLYKDSHFTKMFGAASSASSAKVPPISYALFAVRDSLTVFASFNLPPVLAPVLPVTEEVERYMSRASIAQFLAPASIQALSTPLHLLGLDLYNRPDATLAMRVSRVVRDWAPSFVARVARILPAFGVGGVVNTRVRRTWMEKLETVD